MSLCFVYFIVLFLVVPYPIPTRQTTKIQGQRPVHGMLAMKISIVVSVKSEADEAPTTADLAFPYVLFNIGWEEWARMNQLSRKQYP